MYKTSTHQYQSALAEFCKTGNYKPIPGINETHIKQYRRLVFNVVKDTLLTAYPLTHNLLSVKEWNNLIQEYFSNHNCQSPQIWEMPKELFEYLQQNENHPLKRKYPFIEDLLYFEWLEIELYMMEDIAPLPYKKEGVIAKNKIVLNPEITIFSSQYPIHLKKASEIKAKDKGQYFVAIHRHPENGKVIFTNIQYPHVLLLQALNEKPINFKDVKILLKDFLNEPKSINMLFNFIENGLKKKLFLGFKNKLN